MISYKKGRILVPLEADAAVIPDSWLDMYGRVLLPAKWDEQSWMSLSKNAKRFVYLCLSNYSVWFRHIFLPYEGLRERGYTEEETDALYPFRPLTPDMTDFSEFTGLPRFMNDYCNRLDKHTPWGFVVSEKKPVHDDIWNLMTILPTGCFKSTMTGMGFSLFAIGRDPTVAILIAVETKELGERFIVTAKDHINQNERFRWLHGDLHADDSSAKWQTTAIVVDRPIDRSAPTMEITGYRGAIQGLRFDIGIGDDLISRENSRTPESRARLMEWIDGSEFRGRLNPNRRMRIIVGTFQRYDDYYHAKKIETLEKKTGIWSYVEEKMIQGGTWPPKLVNPERDNAIVKENIVVPDDLVTIWPGEWTAEKLIDEWVDNETTFARTRLNEVVDPKSKIFQVQYLEDIKADGYHTKDGLFRKPLLSRWPVSVGIPQEGSDVYRLYTEQGFTIEQMFFVLSVDLASTETYTSDYTVFHLWGFDRNSLVRVLLNQLRRKMADPDVIGSHLATWVKAYRPDRLVVEANAVEKLFARSLVEVVGRPVNIVEMKGNKIEMIENVRDLISSRLVWVPWANDNYRTPYVFASFMDELNNYPMGHDDTVAAAAHALYALRHYGSPIRATVVRGKPPEEMAGYNIEFEEEADEDLMGVRVFGAGAAPVAVTGRRAKPWDVLNAMAAARRKRADVVEDPRDVFRADPNHPAIQYEKAAARRPTARRS